MLSCWSKPCDLSKCAGILGCGWLGTPLAQTLIRRGYRVKGTTTRIEKIPGLARQGVEARQIRLGESQIEGDISGFLSGLDCLVLNIPPGIRSAPGADFTGRIRLLESHLREAVLPHLIFVSSTSVYGNAQGDVSEADPPHPDSETGRQLAQAEALLLANTSRITQIVRPGGLLGPNRHPVFTLSGKSIPSGGNSRVNLVRLQDLLNILELLVTGEFDSGTYNAVFPDHPTKRDFYPGEALQFGIPPPSYSDGPGPPIGKRILCRALDAAGYTFSHPIRTAESGPDPNGPGGDF